MGDGALEEDYYEKQHNIAEPPEPEVPGGSWVPSNFWP